MTAIWCLYCWFEQILLILNRCHSFLCYFLCYFIIIFLREFCAPADPFLYHFFSIPPENIRKPEVCIFRGCKLRSVTWHGLITSCMYLLCNMRSLNVRWKDFTEIPCRWDNLWQKDTIWLKSLIDKTTSYTFLINWFAKWYLVPRAIKINITVLFKFYYIYNILHLSQKQRFTEVVTTLVFLKILQNSQENTWGGIYSW